MHKLIHSNNLFNENIKIMSNCPVCQKQYGKTNAKVVEEVDEAHLLHIHCSACNSAILAIIFTTGFGITSVGLLTDLTMDDVKKFRQWENISHDEVLNMYSYLKKEKLLNI